MEVVRPWLFVQFKICWHEELPGGAVTLGEGLHYVGVLKAGELTRFKVREGVTRPYIGWCLVT